MRAIFGPPVSRPLPGGLLMSVDIVPIYDGGIVAFRWPGLNRENETGNSLWMPWDYLEVGEPPARSVPRVLSQWTGREDLAISAEMVDLFSKVQDNKTWHLSLVFMVHLQALPDPVGHIEAVEHFSVENLPEACGWFPQERLALYLTGAASSQHK